VALRIPDRAKLKTGVTIMLKIALMMILTAAQIASAQTTWKGLRFGMSEAEVRKQYPASFVKKPIQNDEFELVDRDQKLVGQSASAELFFDKAGKLEQISLDMEPLADDIEATKAAGSSLAVIQMLNKQLVEKYGQATSANGKCDLAAEDLLSKSVPIFTCESLWKSAGETINLIWVVKKMRISTLGLVYKPLASDI
jgi:hypothetical protein